MPNFIFFNLMLALKEKSDDNQSLNSSSSGSHECLQTSIYNNLSIDVEMFHKITGNFDPLVALEERSRDDQSHWASSSGHHECQSQMSWQSIQWFMRYFSLNQSGPTVRPTSLSV